MKLKILRKETSSFVIMVMKRKEFLVRIYIGYRKILEKFDIWVFGKMNKNSITHKNLN